MKTSISRRPQFQAFLAQLTPAARLCAMELGRVFDEAAGDGVITKVQANRVGAMKHLWADETGFDRVLDTALRVLSDASLDTLRDDERNLGSLRALGEMSKSFELGNPLLDGVRSVAPHDAEAVAALRRTFLPGIASATFVPSRGALEVTLAPGADLHDAALLSQKTGTPVFGRTASGIAFTTRPAPPVPYRVDGTDRPKLDRFIARATTTLSSSQLAPDGRLVVTVRSGSDLDTAALDVGRVHAATGLTVAADLGDVILHARNGAVTSLRDTR